MDRRKRAIDAYKRVRDGRDQDTDSESGSSDKDPPQPSERGAGTDDAREAPSRQTADAPTSGEAAHASARRGVGDQRQLDGFEKTGVRSQDGIAEAVADGGSDRAARLLMSLGIERAAEILRRLSEQEVEDIAAAVVRMGTGPARDPEEAPKENAPSRAAGSIRGGPDVAREMLRAAFGDMEGDRAFFRSVPNAPSHHFAFLNDLEPAQLHAAIKDEPPAAAALLIAHIDRSLAAAVLPMLSPERRGEIARRIARMGKLSRDVVVRVEQAIREKIRRLGRPVTEDVDGAATLAAILRHMSPASGRSLLSELREANVDLGESIRRKLYATDLIVELSDRHLADLLREFSDSEIALFLKGKDERLRARVLRAISERRAQTISEEYAHLGARTRDEVERITSEILERMRELEEDGTILVPREGDHYI
jgi:flagellar motor switch protein FliG